MPYCEIQSETESRSAALKSKDDIRAYQEAALRLFANVERMPMEQRMQFRG
jgi:hypothetical protein